MEMEPRETTLTLSYAFFPFLSVLGTSLSLAVLRLARPDDSVLGIRNAGVFPVIVYAIWAAITAAVLVGLLRRCAIPSWGGGGVSPASSCPSPGM